MEYRQWRRPDRSRKSRFVERFVVGEIGFLLYFSIRGKRDRGDRREDVIDRTELDSGKEGQESLRSDMIRLRYFPFSLAPFSSPISQRERGTDEITLVDCRRSPTQ